VHEKAGNFGIWIKLLTPWIVRKIFPEKLWKKLGKTDVIIKKLKVAQKIFALPKKLPCGSTS